MQNTIHERTAMLIGEAALQKLQNSRVAICGIGGVGSYTAEALARSGVGSLLLIDSDTISISNCNRQILALRSTVGQEKTKVMQSRIADIDPAVQVEAKTIFLTADTDEHLFDDCDYIVDAIDNVSAKIRLAQIAKEKGIPFIAAMGCGNKLDPSRLKVTDLYKTDTCPLCRVMRRELKARGITKCKVVYSPEIPRKPITDEQGRTPPASMIFVPAAAGLMMAAAVVEELIEE
ncbi:MAG: tRNA threonylcarbamoyladenosine dehydratase [Clostridia bacterium]|nr:tRNA threonylcarbamoyladenosine dehydratase [Clostridia bacterium]